ncbi:MAG: hypothetical protein ACXAC5_01330 [Promethearchaeota archaeon]
MNDNFIRHGNSITYHPFIISEKQMIRLLLAVGLLIMPSCLSVQPVDPTIFGWIDNNCIDTGRCVPFE